MACIDDVYIIQNPLWNEQAEQGEAAYGEDFDTKVGVFDTGLAGRVAQLALVVL